MTGNLQGPWSYFLAVGVVVEEGVVFVLVGFVVGRVFCFMGVGVNFGVMMDGGICCLKVLFAASKITCVISLGVIDILKWFMIICIRISAANLAKRVESVDSVGAATMAAQDFFSAEAVFVACMYCGHPWKVAGCGPAQLGHLCSDGVMVQVLWLCCSPQRLHFSCALHVFVLCPKL